MLARNTTATPITTNECNESSIRLGLLPEDNLDGDLQATQIADCYDTDRATIPPGATVRYAPYEAIRTWSGSSGPGGLWSQPD